VHKQSIPRLELMAATLAARLAKKIVETFRFEFSQVFYFTDSSSVLGMLYKDSCTFLEFVGNRVSEIKALSPVESWSWFPTDKNLADWGTRGSVDPADLGSGSEYQNRMTWIGEPVETWPHLLRTPPRRSEEGVGTGQLRLGE